MIILLSSRLTSSLSRPSLLQKKKHYCTTNNNTREICYSKPRSNIHWYKEKAKPVLVPKFCCKSFFLALHFGLFFRDNQAFMSFKWVTTATIGCGVIFSSWCPFWHRKRWIWAPFGYFVTNWRTFGAPFTGLNSVVVPQNQQISGNTLQVLASTC